jgi:hypothetical protein
VTTDLSASEIRALQDRVKDLEGEFARLGIDPDSEPRRTDQHCVCSCCGKEYREHPHGGPLGYDNLLFLRRLCDGQLVKL